MSGGGSRGAGAPARTGRRTARRRVPRLLAAALLAALPACGGAPEADGPPRVELVLFGDPVETAGYRSMLEAFEATDPGVDVTLTPVAKQDQLLARLTTAFAGGRPPDVFLVNYRSYGAFADAGALQPVQPYLDASPVLDEEQFAPAALEAFRYDGEELTCMPQNVSSLVVYWNPELFAAAGVPAPEAGWTWADLLAAAQALTGEGTWGLGVEPSVIRVAPFVWSAGGEVVDDPLEPSRLTLDDGPGLDFFLDLSLVHGVVPPDAAEQSQDALSRFAAGGLGMYLDSRKVVPGLREASSQSGLAWDVAPLPVAPGGTPATILHGDAYCIAAASPHRDAAWQLVEFAMGETGQRLLAASGRTVPSRTDVAASADFLRPDAPPASARVFLDAVPTVRAVPHVAGWSELEDRADAVLAEVFYGRLPRERGVQELRALGERLLGDR